MKTLVAPVVMGLWMVASPAVPPLHRLEFSAVHMGTPVRMVLFGPDSALAREAARAAFARIAELDNIMSDYLPGSEVRSLSERPREWVAVSPDLFAVLARSVEFASRTDGAFDPTIGPVVALWRESRRTRRLPDESLLAAARRTVNWRLIELDALRGTVRLAESGMKLDLGGIAKGYIIQQALEVLRAYGHAAAMIEAGGDVVVGDAPPDSPGWLIDVRGAGDDLESRARELTNAAIATSGSREQFVEIDGVRYAHVVDPRTGLGLTRAFEVTVIAADGATADALATAAGILGPDERTRLGRLFPLALIGFRN